MKGKLAVLSFLIFALASATSIACVFANFTPDLPSDNIAIEADGKVTGTDTIIRNGDTYTFTGNVSGTKTRQGEVGVMYLVPWQFTEATSQLMVLGSLSNATTLLE